MTRHGKNCTAGAVYTYHEKQKDTKSSGYGTRNMRIGKDSVKNFDCCCLTLQPCRNPVITLDGYLFDKEAILEYILHQKREITRKIKEYDKQKNKMKMDLLELDKVKQQSKVENFVKTEGTIVSKPINPFKRDSEAGQSVSNMIEGKDMELPSFWVPSLTPQSKPTLIKKPDKTVYCPMSGNSLTMKDLIPVKFTLINDGENKALICKETRYKCAVTHDALNNSVPCAVLKTSGHVVTMECVEKLIKIDMIDPTNGEKLSESDIISIQRGGTGFSGTGTKLLAKVVGPAMMT